MFKIYDLPSGAQATATKRMHYIPIETQQIESYQWVYILLLYYNTGPPKISRQIVLKACS